MSNKEILEQYLQPFDGKGGRTFGQIVHSYDSTFSEPYIHQDFTLVLKDGRILSVDTVKELYTLHLLKKSKIKLVSYKDIGLSCSFVTLNVQNQNEGERNIHLVLAMQNNQIVRAQVVHDDVFSIARAQKANRFRVRKYFKEICS